MHSMLTASVSFLACAQARKECAKDLHIAPQKSQALSDKRCKML